jgi:hypothetical protein
MLCYVNLQIFNSKYFIFKAVQKWQKSIVVNIADFQNFKNLAYFVIFVQPQI